ALGGVVEKHADQAAPDTAQPVLREYLKNPIGDQQPGEGLASERGPISRAPQVAGRSPQDREEHSAAVERKGRNQVENKNRPVDYRQVTEDQYDGRRPPGPEADPCQDGAYGSQDKTDDRAGNGHDKLAPGGRRLVAELGHSAKQEKRDATDRNAPRT